MGFNVFKSVGNVLGGGKATTFNPEVAKMDAGLFNQWGNDIGGVRSLANSPVNSLNASGLASQKYADTAYQNQLNQLGMQGQSALASGMANSARYGMDSGSAERMARQNMMGGMLGQQNLGAANMENQANIAQQNLAMQEQQKYGALMSLPQLQQAQTMGKYGADYDAAKIRNDALMANMSANAARNQGIGNALGSIGTIAGGAFGGPVGAMAGGAIGTMAGGLFK